MQADDQKLLELKTATYYMWLYSNCTTFLYIHSSNYYLSLIIYFHYFVFSFQLMQNYKAFLY